MWCRSRDHSRRPARQLHARYRTTHSSLLGTGRPAVSLRSAATCCQASITIRTPGRNDARLSAYFTSGGFIDVKTLPQTGTYTISVDAPGDRERQHHAPALRRAARRDRSIVPGGGPAARRSRLRARSHALLHGQAGRRVSCSSVPDLLPCAVVSSKPRRQHAEQPRHRGPSGVPRHPDPAGRRHVHDPRRSGRDRYRLGTFQLYDVPLRRGRADRRRRRPATVTTSRPRAKTAKLTFTGQAGQRVSLKIGPTCCQTTDAVKNPDGIDTHLRRSLHERRLHRHQDADAERHLHRPRRPGNNRHRHRHGPALDVPPDVPGPIAPGGSPVTVTHGDAGQNAHTLRRTGRPAGSA